MCHVRQQAIQKIYNKSIKNLPSFKKLTCADEVGTHAPRQQPLCSLHQTLCSLAHNFSPMSKLKELQRRSTIAWSVSSGRPDLLAAGTMAGTVGLDFDT